MTSTSVDGTLLARIEKAFRRAFGARAAFDESLERAVEPRWTSLKHVEFLIALEEEFGLRFDGTDATDLISIRIVRERLAALLGTPQ
jgi:acyl carrier protein